jgi:hypothetical protein
MTLVIRKGESQKSLIRRTLIDRGSVSVQECLFDMRDEEGKSRAITRLASIIFDLRTYEDMFIIEVSKHGETATYIYVKPAVEAPAPVVTVHVPKDLPLVNFFMGTVECPVKECDELIDTSLLHEDPADPSLAFAVCSKHGWKAVRVA